VKYHEWRTPPAPTTKAKPLAGSFSRLAVALAVGIAAAGGNGAASAGQVQLDVSATVLKRASLQVLAQPASLTLTEADVARGYVEVAAPAQIAVKNNSAEGYLLVVASRGDFLRQMRMRGLGGDVQMSADGGFVRQPPGPVVTTVLDLGFRFELSESAQPGVYAWPVQLSVRPL
jgi:hypothetical protein